MNILRKRGCMLTFDKWSERLNMGYYTSTCRYCHDRDGINECDCRCHTATQEDIELGLGRCDPVEID